MAEVSPYLSRPLRPWSRALHELYLAARDRRPLPLQPAAEGEAGADRRTPPVRILIVDDEDEVRDLVATILADLQFEIVQARDGTEALRLMREAPATLLLTDLRMPGIDGLELARRAKELNPDLRTLFMSGYAARYRIDPSREDFIGKPFLAHGLVGCVYEILGRS
jgi:CheY-like chemotaxis protein